MKAPTGSAGNSSFLEIDGMVYMRRIHIVVRRQYIFHFTDIPGAASINDLFQVRLQIRQPGPEAAAQTAPLHKRTPALPGLPLPEPGDGRQMKQGQLLQIGR